MKKDLLLFAGVGLIGYGLFKFLSPKSSSTGLGSPFFSSGTARVPSVLGAAKPGSAPVFGPGYSTASDPSKGGTDILPLVQGAIAAGQSLWESVRRWTSGSRGSKTPEEIIYPGGVGGAPSAFGRDYVPDSHSPVPDFSDYLNPPPYQGVDDFDTSDVGSIA